MYIEFEIKNITNPNNIYVDDSKYPWNLYFSYLKKFLG